MQPRFLVIIPTYGQFDYAAAACESLFRTTPDAAVMVVDDASPEMLDRYKYNENGPHPLLAEVAKEYQTRFMYLGFPDNGGLTRSWNEGLRAARLLNFEFACCTNSDVLFTRGWTTSLVHWLDKGYALVGPVSNAPGITAEGRQEVDKYLLGYHLNDSPEYLDGIAEILYKRHFNNVVLSSVNGFCMMAKTVVWWQNAFDKEHVFKPSNPWNSKGRPNPTPLMTLNEDELQGRWHKAGLKTAVVPGSFVFHYRAATRGERYKRGKWFRKVT